MSKEFEVDLLLVNPPGKRRVYQVLANEFAAYEPPIWAGLIAKCVQKAGRSVQVLDAEALNLTIEDTVRQIVARRPMLTVFAVYGQQPSASTQCMPVASETCGLLKDTAPDLKTLFLGTHPSSLPERTMQEEKTDFVCEGEGPYTILGLIQAIKADSDAYDKIPGLWYRKEGVICSTTRAPNISDLDSELNGMAWDLLPMDRYKAHNWHCWDHIHSRMPYASIYTSLGCPYKCNFCCINAPFGGRGIRYFSPDTVIAEIDTLVTKYGVKNIKFADELFVLNRQHVFGICDRIIQRGYDLNIWAYARIDSIRDEYLEKLKRAGVNWLALGIESGSKFVRNGAEKGRFTDQDIIKVVDKIKAAGIYVGANYIFGLPDDTMQSMQETLDLALHLNSEWANFYCAMAYPGSALHTTLMNRELLPESASGPGWIGYSQHAYETFPLPTDTVPAGQVLSFRDRAFDLYFTGEPYRNMMKNKFGDEVLKHIDHMTSHKLERKYALPL